MTTATPSVCGGGSSSSASAGGLDLSDLLECSICLEPLGLDHRVLPCQHTFCLSCLQDLEKKAKILLCPECRAQINTPIKALPTNVILNRILSGITSSKAANTLAPNHAAAAAPVMQHKKAPPPPLALGEHRKLPLPSPKFDNNNLPSCIPGNWSTNPFLSSTTPPPESPLPLLPPKIGAGGAPKAAPPPLPARPPAVAPAAQPQPQPPSSLPLASPHQIFRALYDYKPVKSDELALKKDEMYFVIEKCQDGWFKGSSLTSLKTGVFPGNYVVQVVEPGHQAPSFTKKKSPDLIDLTTEEESVKAKSSDVKQVQKMSNETLYRATMPFPASSQYELELKQGDTIVMNKIREDGWCKGTLQRTGQTGLFPLSFVEKIS